VTAQGCQLSLAGVDLVEDAQELTRAGLIS
jgi:hypothetical protein